MFGARDEADAQEGNPLPLARGGRHAFVSYVEKEEIHAE
jgi:hypothetical protein